MNRRLSHRALPQSLWSRLSLFLVLGVGLCLFPAALQAKPVASEIIYLPTIQTNDDSALPSLVYDFASSTFADLQQLEAVLSPYRMQVAGNEDQIEIWADVADNLRKVLEISCSGEGCLENHTHETSDIAEGLPLEANLKIVVKLTSSESLHLNVESLTRVIAVLVKDGKEIASILFTCESEDCVIHIDKSDFEAAPEPEPTPTETPVVDPPDPPSEGDIEPYAGAPLCTTHDPRAWHSLWNAKLGCHYDHEHKDNPHLVDDIFGTKIYELAGGELSYPWQTFHGAGTGFPTSPGAGHMENDMKHEGYMWLVRRGMSCANAKTNGCITDMRVQVHAIFSAAGAVTRFHSYWYEARVCVKNRPNQCGIVRNGGWLDFGYLVGEGPGCAFPCIVKLPGMPDPSEINHPTGPKRQHKWIGGFNGNNASSNWYGHNRHTGLQNKIALATSDVWQNVDVKNPSVISLACPDFRCQYNGSTMQLHQFSFILRNNTFGSQNKYSSGTMNYSGYTDRYGNIVTNCSAPGLDCIPLMLENAPTAGSDNHLTFYEHIDGSNGIGTLEYDLSPAGEWWIEYPN